MKFPMFTIILTLMCSQTSVAEPGYSTGPPESPESDPRGVFPPNCFPIKILIQSLAEKFKEYAVLTAIVDNGSYEVVFATNNGTTWTEVLVDPNSQLACIIHSGTDLRLIVPEPKTQGS